MQLFFSYTRIQKICISVFTLGAFMAFCLGFGVAIKPANAAESCPAQAFYIKGIDVAVDDESSEIARIKATTQAQQKAWQALQSRLLLPEQPFIADNASVIDSVLDYIRIDQETVLETRYQGRFDYCFDRVKTRALFKDQGIRHAELISGDMLVLPVWNEAKTPRLWRQPNPWMQVWQDLLPNHIGLVQMKMPQSLSIERSVKVEDLLIADQKAIATAAQFEQAERVILAILTPELDGQSIDISMTAKLFRANGRFDSDIYQLDGISAPVDEITDQLSQLARGMASGIEGAWRKANQINLEDGGVLVIHVPAQNIDQWTGQLAILENLPPVDQVEVVQLSSSGGVVRLKLAGSFEALSNALEQHQLKIENSEDDGNIALKLVSTSTP